MPIILRRNKEAPLSIDELDNNFQELNQRLKRLETEPAMAEGIAEIIQEGDQLVITGTFGSPLGSFVLPQWRPTLRGVWKTGEAYTPSDWACHGKKIFACEEAHQADDFSEDCKAQMWKRVI